MSFSRAFLAGMQARDARDKRKEEERLRAEMAEIANQKPIESQGYTEDQGADLRAAAERGDKIDIQYKDDGQGNQVFDRYVVTPKMPEGQSGPTQPREVAMQGVTDFMGNRTAGRMTQDQIERGRMMAMAGVLGRHDPMEGMRLRREVKSQERDDQRWTQQQKEWDFQNQERTREVEYRTGRERLLQSSPMGRAQAAMTQYEQDLAAYNAAIRAGRSPQEIGPPPQRPNIQRPGPMQTLAGYADLIAHDFKYGKLNTDGLIQFQERMQKLEQENYTRALLVAQNGGSPEQIANAFNASGMQVDPQNITINRSKQTNGPDLVTLSYKDERGQVVSIPVMAELEAYDKAKSVYERFYQGERNRRDNEQLRLSQNADRRAGAQVAQGQADRTRARAEAEAARIAEYNLWKEQNPGATPAQDAAARARILKPRVTGPNAEVESEFKADPLGGGYVTQRDSAGNLTITTITRDGTLGTSTSVRAPSQNSASPAPAPIARGQVVDGYEFRGGDPNDPRNWRQVNRP